MNHLSYAEAAQKQHTAVASLLSKRGNIYAFDYSTNEKKIIATNVTESGDPKRYYPLGLFASQVMGFVGYKDSDRVGQYGVESFYDETLRGLEPTQKLVGDDIVLTIDPNVQTYVESTLNSLIKKYSSTGGQVIVQDPNTGAIIAMASSPSFDPNQYSKFPFQYYLNKNVQEQFEPGSTFKSFTMSGAIEKNAVTPETTYEDKGEVVIGKYTIRNYDDSAHGVRTMREVLEKSLNTGIVFVEKRLGNDNFLNYVTNFGFGQKTGIDVGGEISGNISNLYENHEVNFATAAFGQGVAVTPIQLINAYSAIANGGKLMRPYVLKEVTRIDGSKQETKPKIIRQVINEKTSNTMKSMLVDVVEKGFDKGQVPGYDVAGKTGTAQIPDKDGGYLGDKQYIHDFVGFAPAYAPRFTVLIKIDRPQGITFASRSLSPVFADIMSYLLRYYKIPPTK